MVETVAAKASETATVVRHQWKQRECLPGDTLAVVSGIRGEVVTAAKKAAVVAAAAAKGIWAVHHKPSYGMDSTGNSNF